MTETVSILETKLYVKKAAKAIKVVEQNAAKLVEIYRDLQYESKLHLAATIALLWTLSKGKHSMIKEVN